MRIQINLISYLPRNIFLIQRSNAILMIQQCNALYLFTSYISSETYNTFLGWEFYPIMDHCPMLPYPLIKILWITFTSTGGTDRDPNASLPEHMMLLLFGTHRSIWYRLVDHPFFGFWLEHVLRGTSISIDSLCQHHTNFLLARLRIELKINLLSDCSSIKLYAKIMFTAVLTSES